MIKQLTLLLIEPTSKIYKLQNYNNMKALLIIILTCVLSCNNNDTTKKKQTKIYNLNTNTNEIILMFNDQSFPWQISDDKLNFPYNGKENTVTFLSKIDTLKFVLPIGKTIPVNIILNKTDTIRAEAVGISKPANFDKKYIAKNKGHYNVFLPKVHELINIAFALTSIGQKDANMVNNKTDYYADVMNYFIAYKNHPLIDSLNSNMKNYAYDYYYSLRMNACMYTFTKEYSIKNKSPYNRLAFGGTNYLEELLPQLSDFAKKTNFENFYTANKEYYDSLITSYYKFVPVKKMWKWLEEKSSEHYDAYNIYFSPLIGGMHSTNHFTDNDYKETVMFVSAPIFLEEYTNTEKEIQESRIVFTEIDHNYVNPISDKLTPEINTSFSNRFFWVLDDPGLNGYPNPYTVFNEYITWSLYSLYCMDYFSKNDYDKYIAIMENEMIVKRGFIKFREFDQKLIQLYIKDRNISLIDLSKSILEWSKQIQKSFKE